jgi:hypothetical protein
MTKKQALNGFHELRSCQECGQVTPSNDRIALWESWSTYTAGLYADSRITLDQCRGWTNPFQEKNCD